MYDKVQRRGGVVLLRCSVVYMVVCMDGACNSPASLGGLARYMAR
jgi:hypothetical protein